MRSEIVQALSTLMVVLTISFAYSLPSLLAIVRKSPRWVAVAGLNLLFGWTVVGWFASMALVFRPVKVRAKQPKLRSTRQRASVKKSKPAANDNASIDAVAPAFATTPAPLNDDAYGDWLARGEALDQAGHEVADDAEGRRPEPRVHEMPIAA